MEFIDSETKKDFIQIIQATETVAAKAMRKRKVEALLGLTILTMI